MKTQIKNHLLSKLNNSTIFLGAIWVIVFSSFGLAQSNEETEKPNTRPSDETIRLESRFIGDKEQPAVSYFIPWKGSDSPDELQWKIERKNDDTLDLVDRDILLRSMTIYNQMKLEPPSQ